MKKKLFFFKVKLINIQGHKINLNKFKRMGIILCVFSDHNEIKLEINEKISRQFPNIWKLTQL